MMISLRFQTREKSLRVLFLWLGESILREEGRSRHLSRVDPTPQQKRVQEKITEGTSQAKFHGKEDPVLSKKSFMYLP